MKSRFWLFAGPDCRPKRSSRSEISNRPGIRSVKALRMPGLFFLSIRRPHLSDTGIDINY
jgi:hypothetical protein